jgi:hypothetical protein
MGFCVWQILVHGGSIALPFLPMSIISPLNGWEEKWPLRVFIVNHIGEGVLYHLPFDGGFYCTPLSWITTSFLRWLTTPPTS